MLFYYIKISYHQTTTFPYPLSNYTASFPNTANLPSFALMCSRFAPLLTPQRQLPIASNPDIPNPIKYPTTHTHRPTLSNNSNRMENREHFLIKAHPHHKHSQRTYEPVVATVSSHFLVAIEMLMSLRTVRPPKRRKGFTFSARNRTFEPCNGANEYSIFVVPAVSIGLKKHICIFIHTPLFLSHSLGIKFAMIFAIAQRVNSSCS